MPPIDRDEFRDYMQLLREQLRSDHEQVRDDIRGVGVRVDTLAERTRENRAEIEKLQAVATDSAQDAARRRRKRDGLIGSVAALAASAFAALAHLVMRRLGFVE